MGSILRNGMDAEDEEAEILIGELLFKCSRGILKGMIPGLLKAELRSRGFLPEQLTKEQLVEVLLVLNCELSRKPNREELIDKIRNQRKI
jgi:hypothetical protein